MKVVKGGSSSQPTRLVFSESREKWRIELHKILYCKAHGNYTILCLQDETKCICHSLGKFKEMLEPHGFICIHKSFLVNEDYIETLTSDKKPMVILCNNQKLEVARRRRAAVAKKLFS